MILFFFHGTSAPLVGQGLQIVEASRSRSLIHITLGRTPLDRGSVKSRDLYLTNATSTTGRHPCIRRDSKSYSQQERGHWCYAERWKNPGYWKENHLL